MIKIIVMLTTIFLGIQHTYGDVDTQKVENLSKSNSNVITRPGDQATLSEIDGITKIDYDIYVNETHQVGHQTFNQVSFQILLKQPISLRDDQRRIIYEALGFDDHSKKMNKRVLIAPIIVDESGEQLIYTSKSFPHLKHGSHRWSKLMSSDFFVGEAGGATQDVFEAQGGDGNAWPNGNLSFAGFQINVRKSEFGRRKGVLYFGDVSIGGVKLPIQNPYAYADGFFKKEGTYRLAAEIRNNFQATPIRELDVKIHYDPDNMVSRKQRIEFPLGRVDNYWINYQITDALGHVVASNMMRYQINNSEDTSIPQHVDTNKAPVLGYLRINSMHEGRGVYQQDEELVVKVRAFAKDKKELKLEWKLTPWGYQTVLDSGSQKVAFKNGVFSDLNIIPKTEKGRDAYKLYLTVRAEGKTIDSHVYCLGYKTDLKQSHSRQGIETNRHEIKKHTYNRTTYTRPSRLKFKNESDEVNDFFKYLKNSIQIARNVTYMVDLLDFEVLPGVFDFNLLDKIMDASADYGSKVTVRIAHVDNPRAIPGGQYLWPKYSRQHNYDGSEIDAHHYGAYAVTDPRTTKLWLDSYKALFARYRNHTAFQGYYIMQPGGEWTVIDKPWEGLIAGYSEASALGFRDYMKTNMGLSLSQVNQRWETSFKSWSEIQPPLPALKLGAKPDLRMQWVDFNRFKRALDTEIWMPQAVNSIRSYDNDRITICYGQPDKQTLLYGKLDYCHNGGNHYGNFLGQYVDAWEKGKIGWITEPHHPHRWAAYGDPAQKGWVLDWSVWVMIAQAGGGGTNLHTYYYPNPTLDLAAHYAGDYNYDGFEKYKPILEELVSLRLQGPPIEVAALQDEYTLFTKHRTTFGSRLDDLKRWFELLKNDAVGHDELLKLDVAKGKKYKLILPNALDEVMSKENIEAANTLVRNGAKMIMTANTGSYCPEYGKEPFQFLKKLGITAPRGPYVQNSEAVEAKSVTQSPLFEKGATVPFFSLADLQADLQSDVVKKGFWKYPYRWIPQTDYFGHYPENKDTNGAVLAKFTDGGVALSLHKVGRGEVIVFWGTPDMREDKLKGMMDKATIWADAVNPRKGSPIPNTIEGYSDKLKRHYALLYHETAGTYTQKLITVPDGEWFLDDMVSGQKLGLYTGKELRDNGLELTFVEGYSPLKAIRMLPKEQNMPRWLEAYRTINK
jgi:hypothetical protein